MAATPCWIAFGAILIGIVLASAIQLLTGYSTKTHLRPVKDIEESSETGSATVVLADISIGMESAVLLGLTHRCRSLRRLPAGGGGDLFRWPRTI